MTPQQQLNQVRLRIDEPAEGTSPFWKNAEIMQYLFEAQGYLMRQMVMVDDTIALAYYDLDLVADQAEYSLPLNARLGVRWALAENRTNSNQQASYVYDTRFQNFLAQEGVINVGSVTDGEFQIVLQRDKLRVVPTPASNYTAGIRFWYAPMFGDMHQGTVAGVSSTTLTFPSTPTFGKGANSIDATDVRDDYFNAMDVMIVSGTGAGQVRRISDYDGGTLTITVPTWDTTPDTSSVYAVLSPLPEDFHHVQVLRAAWSAAAKRPRLRQAIAQEFAEAFAEALGFLEERDSLRSGQVIPSDFDSH